MKRKILNTVLTVGAVVAGISVATPARANDNHCRDFNQKIKINGKFERAYGRACLQPNGTWKIVSTHKEHHGDDHGTSHYTINKTYTHTSPFLIDFGWIDHHHKHYKKRHRRYHRHRHKYHRHGHKKHQCKYHH